MRRSQRATKKPEFLTFPDRRNVEDFDQSDTDDSTSNKEPIHLKKVVKKGQSSSRMEGKKLQSVVIPEVAHILSSIKTNKVAAINNLVNFCLRAAGCGDWIDEDIDLEPLGPEEIDRLLEDQINNWAESSETKSYPLIEKSKGRGASFLSKYHSFWVTVTKEFISLRNSRSNSNDNQQLRVILEILVCFSSIAVAAIRDTVTVALLSISDTIIERAIACKAQIDVLKRQQFAFTKSKQNDEDKLTTVKKERATLEKELAQHVETIDSLFHTVYMHRSRDTNSEVRLHTLQHLLTFASFHPHPDVQIKSDYLKYLGWACNDSNEMVRQEATIQLKKLVNDDVFLRHEEVNSFILSFVPRFVQMAACDVSESVSLEMLRVLRQLQRSGYLDNVSETQLDTVDALVFDSQLSLDIRVESLLFLFEHTEGFDEDDNDMREAANEKVINSKEGNRRGSKGRALTDRVKPRKHIALQIETLTEFAEYHLASIGSNAIFAGASLLAEAVLNTHKKELLYDWTTLFALLMRESDALVSQTLRHAQIQVLLAMFVYSAKSICRFSASNNNVNKKAATMEKDFELYRQLQELLNLHFKEMVIRFQDEESQLILLSELMLCIDFSVANENELLGDLKFLFDRCNDGDQLQRNVVLVLKQWHKNSASNINKPVCQRMAQSIASENVVEAESYLSKLAQENLSKLNKRGTNRRQSFTDIRNALHSLKQNMKRIRVFSESFSMDFFLVTSSLLRVPIFLSNTIETIRGISKNATDNIDCNDLLLVGRDALSIWLQEVLWLFRALIDRLQVDTLSERGESKEKPSLSEESEVLLSKLLERRNHLVATCETLLKSYSSDQDLERMLALEAFRIISALRSFFPLNSKQFHNLSLLAFQPSESLLQALHLVFEQEEMRLRDRLEQEDKMDEGNNHDTEKFASELANNLLLPLSRSLLLDASHMNKRQAAAVLRYLDDDNQHLQEIAKQFGKKLKEQVGFTRVAETHLTCLKLFFHEQVSPWIKQILKYQNQDDADSSSDIDILQLERNEERSYQLLQSLAKKLSLQLVPVGRARGDTQQCILALCRAAIDYSLQDKINCSQIGFVCVVEPFLRLLNENEQNQLKEHLLGSLQKEDSRQIFDRIEDERAAPSIAFSKLFEVASLLESVCGTNVSSLSLRRKMRRGLDGARKETKPKAQRKGRGSSSLMDIVEENEIDSEENNDSDYGRRRTETVDDLDIIQSSSMYSNRNTNSTVVAARRSSNRFLGRNPVNYNDESDNDGDNKNDALISPIVRRSSGGYVSHGIESNEKKGRKQMVSPVLDLDVEGDDDESEMIEDVSKKISSPKSFGKRALLEIHSGDDDFHKVSSSRRRLS